MISSSLEGQLDLGRSLIGLCFAGKALVGRGGQARVHLSVRFAKIFKDVEPCRHDELEEFDGCYQRDPSVWDGDVGMVTVL